MHPVSTSRGRSSEGRPVRQNQQSGSINWSVGVSQNASNRTVRIDALNRVPDGRRRTQANELTKRAAEAEARLKRLYAAIESGVADLDDPSLNERIDELKATRDQARVDAERAKVAIETAGQSLTPAQLTRFASAARRRIRGKDGGFRRDHLRAFAQRVEVAEHEVRIMGSHNELLRLLTSSNGVETAANGVRIYVPGWRRVKDLVRTRSLRPRPRPGLSPAPAEPLSKAKLARAKYNQATCRSQRLLRNRLTRRRRHLLIAGLAWRAVRDKNANYVIAVALL